MAQRGRPRKILTREEEREMQIRENEYNRLYYERNRERMRAYQREYQRAHRERIKELHRLNARQYAAAEVTKRHRELREKNGTDFEKISGIFADPQARAHFMWLMEHRAGKKQ